MERPLALGGPEGPEEAGAQVDGGWVISQSPAITQGQYLISDASIKKIINFSTNSYSFSMKSMRRCCAYVPTPKPNPSHQQIWRLLALTETADWEFGTLFTCFVLTCAFPLVISRVVADGLSQKNSKSNLTQLGLDRFLILLLISPPVPRKQARQLTMLNNPDAGEYRRVPPMRPPMNCSPNPQLHRGSVDLTIHALKSS